MGDQPKRRRSDRWQHYLTWAGGIVLMVLASHWTHHLVHDDGTSGGWYVWAFVFTVFMMGLFMAFPKPAREIIRQLRSTVPILRDPEEDDAS